MSLERAIKSEKEVGKSSWQENKAEIVAAASPSLLFVGFIRPCLYGDSKLLPRMKALQQAVAGLLRTAAHKQSEGKKK